MRLPTPEELRGGTPGAAPGPEPDTLAGFLRDTIRRFVHRPNAPLPKSASEAVLQACDDDDGAED